MAPGDWRHAKVLLLHQLQQWANQVDEVIVTIDEHRSEGRFSRNWEEGRQRIRATVEEALEPYSHAHWVSVDYSETTKEKLAKRFFGGSSMPNKDYRGGPFYSYFYGLGEAKYDLVFHTDSDIFYGGGSQNWMAEATELLVENTDLLFCSPLPGPPTKDGHLTTQESKFCDLAPNAHRFSTMSTRLFLTDRSRFTKRLCPLPLPEPNLRNRIKALVEGNPPYKLPEDILSNSMLSESMFRVDFLGSSPGMWSLHPPYRTDEFYSSLPHLISQVENGNVPESQKGKYDMDDSMVDWSPARKAMSRNRWWQRLWRRMLGHV